MFLFGFLRVYHVKTETIVKLCVKNFETASLQELYPFKAPVFPNHLNYCTRNKNMWKWYKKIKINENLIDIIDAE